MRSLLTALVLFASAAHAYEVKRDSTGAITTWKAPLHFILDEKLNDKLATDDATAAVQAALTTLQPAVPGVTLDAAPGKTHGVGYDFEHPTKSTSDVVVPEDWKWDDNAVAITVVSVSKTTHEILEADIAFNAKHTAFAVVSGGSETERYDVQNAMTHELGHSLGLAHNPNRPESLMYPHSTPGEVSKRVLATDDLDGLKFLYPVAAIVAPTAGPQGCSSTGSAPFALLAVVMAITVRRRRALVALASVVGALLFVAPAFAAPVVGGAWVVSSVRTLAPGAGSQVLQSEVTVVRDGVYRTTQWAGGSWGDVEQIVEGVAVPAPGDAVELADAQPFAPSGH